MLRQRRGNDTNDAFKPTDLSPSSPRLSGEKTRLRSSSSLSIVDPWAPSPRTVFYALASIRAAQSTLLPWISDCDEVYNYWEPLHYLLYGHGFQTWEYSPAFAIRSWLYPVLHALIADPIRLILSFVPIPTQKLMVFFAVRTVLAVLCAKAEAAFYSAIVDTISPRIARYTLIFLALSPGMFIASSAYLPSSFAMMTTMMAMARWLQIQSYNNAFQLARPLWWFGLGALVGWPFSAALAVPFAVEALIVRLTSHKSTLSGSKASLFYRFLVMATATILISSLLLGAATVVDYAFYRKWWLAPLHIVWYNVFGHHGGGPDVFGTEPWWFYLLNGLLQFNLAFPAALLSLFILVASWRWRYDLIVANTNVNYLAAAMGLPYPVLLCRIAPLYLWMAVFTWQAHKEERFLFCVYPMIAFCAAVSLAFTRSWLMSVMPDWRRVRRLMVYAFLIVFSCLSAMRIAALQVNYTGAIKIYRAIQADAEGTLCVGDRWYDFPSHFWIPSTLRVKFLDTMHFDGLLPKYFNESKSDNDTSDPIWARWIRRRGQNTWLSPPGFNPLNQRVNDDRMTTLDQCDYVVDLDWTPPKSTQWTTVQCERYLNAQKTSRLARIFWLPARYSPDKHWSHFCLFQQQSVNQ